MPTVALGGSELDKSVDAEDDDFVSHSFYLSSVVLFSLLYRYRLICQAPLGDYSKKFLLISKASQTVTIVRIVVIVFSSVVVNSLCLYYT